LEQLDNSHIPALGSKEFVRQLGLAIKDAIETELAAGRGSGLIEGAKGDALDVIVGGYLFEFRADVPQDWLDRADGLTVEEVVTDALRNGYAEAIASSRAIERQLEYYEEAMGGEHG